MMFSMNGDDISKIITATGSLVGALAGAAAMIIGIANRKTVMSTAATVDQVHKQTDGLTKELVASSAIVAEAIGRAKGVAQEEIRASALKQGQDQMATEAAKIQTDAAKVQEKAATIQTAAATIQSEAAKKKEQ